MLYPVLLILAALTLTLVVRHYLGKTRIGRLAPSHPALLWLFLFLLFILLFTGRLGFLIPMLGALAALLIRALPALLPLLTGYLNRYRTHPQPDWKPSSQGSQTGTTQTRFLRMHINPATGDMWGDILEGPWRGQSLAQLDISQLAALYDTCQRADRESAALLMAYLEHAYGRKWRDTASREKRHGNDGGISGHDEAYEILGLEPGASQEEIIQAHRRLMQKLHPDRGGSDYLASRINKARDILLGA